MVFRNVYQMITPPSVIKKSWFVEWFDGDALRAIWREHDQSGTGTFGMQDGIDEGYQIEAAALNGNSSNLDFNNFRHYDENNSAIEAVARRVTASSFYFVGLIQDANSVGGFTDTVIMINRSSNTFYRAITIDGIAGTEVATSIAVDLNFHRTRIILHPSSIDYFLDGILEATIVANLPTNNLQPVFSVGSQLNGTPRQGRIRYFESYNT